MIHDIEQGTDAWLRLRLGKVTASKISDMLARTQKGWGASRDSYRAQLVVERLTGQVQDTFRNASMEWGTVTEPMARDAYAQHMLCTVQQVGFVDHPRISWAGCSPDGLVDEDGLIEAKCPESKTHIATLLGSSFPDKYVKQAMWQMACLPERKWVDLVSYDPRVPEPMRLFVQRIVRDDAAIGEIEREVESFLREVDDTVAQLQSKFDLAGTLSASLEAA
jgi:putative phage-type endonuclease